MGSCPKFGLIEDWFYDFVIRGIISKILIPVLIPVLKIQYRQILNTGIENKSVICKPYLRISGMNTWGIGSSKPHFENENELVKVA